jgi:hypothetical protein
MSDLTTNGTGEEIIFAQQFPNETDWLTKTAAKAEDAEMMRSDAGTKMRFFCFVARRGHIALGYPNLTEYCRDRGMDASTGYRWVKTVLVGMILGDCDGPALLSDMQRGQMYLKLPTAQVAEILFTLRDPDLIKEAADRYEQARGIPANGTKPVEIQQIRNIVSCLLPKPVLPEPPPVANDPQTFGNLPKSTEPIESNLLDAPAVLPPTNPTHARFVAPPDADAPAVAALPGEVDAEPVFDYGDRPDYLATSAEFDDDPNRRGWWIDFTGKDGRTECLFLPEAMANEAPAR